MAFQKYTFKTHRLFKIAYISGGIASIADLWKTEARPYMHALQFMISLGGIVTPFIIQPFLAVSYPSVTNVTQLQVTDDSYTTNPLWLENSTYVKLSMKEAFKIDEIDPIATDSEDFTNVSDFDNHTRELNISSEMRAFGETKIQYAFIIFATVGVAASVAVFVFVATDYRNKQNKHKDNHKDHHTDINRRKISVTDNMKYILIAIIAIQSYLSAALGLKVYAFLPSFFVIQFSWTSSTASVATSGFWIGKAIARLAGVFLSTKIKQSILVPCFTLIYIASSISLMVAANSHINVLAWVITVTMGIGLSILRSSLFNITEEKITHVSGKIASLYLVFFVLGGMIDPLYTGYLMDDASPMWFVYLLIIESSLFLFLFIIVTALLWKFGKRQETGIEIEIEPMKKEEPAGT